jgi:hypothetical protein
MARRHLDRRLLELERCPGGPRGVVGQVAVLVEDRHHRVADDLVHHAAVALQQRHEPAEVAVQHRRHAGGGRLLGEGREALQVGEENAGLARLRERLVEVEWAEALLVPLTACADCDREEGDQHQQVPLPPRDAPVPRPRDHEHRLGEQRERQRDSEQELRAAAPVEVEVADRSGRVEHDADGRERDLPAVQLLGAELARQGLDPRERDRSPAGEERGERGDQQPRPVQHPLGGSRAQRQTRRGGEHARDREAERRRQLEAAVLAEQHARRRECVEPEETGRGHERERDEEQAGVAPPPAATPTA